MLKRRILLAVAALALLFGVAAVWAFPRVVGALPSAVRGRLPEPVLRLVITPLPTALPAAGLPAATADLDALLAPAEIAPTATLPPIATPTLTATVAAADIDLPAATPTLAPTATPQPTATTLPPPMQAMLTGLEIMPQKFNNCGPANLTIVLNYLGQPSDQLDVGAAIKPNYDDRNVSPHELAAYANQQTPLRAAVFAGGDLEMLQRLIAAGFPVIIEKGYEGSAWEGWMGHYLTVIGYDHAAETFTSLDTFLGPWDSSGRVDSFATIERYWQQFNHTFIVVYDPADEPRLNEVVGAEMLDPVAMWSRALAQAQTAVRAEAANPYAWFNLGSSGVRLAELTNTAVYYENAALAFDEARRLGLPPRMLWYQFAPYEAYLAVGRTDDVLTLTAATLANEGGQNVEETYFYQGLALQQLGDDAGAVAAWEQAVTLNPGFAQAQTALLNLPEASR